MFIRDFQSTTINLFWTNYYIWVPPKDNISFIDPSLIIFSDAL